jgi:hypothetical protein
MGARPPWTDREVAFLLHVRNLAALAEAGCPGFEEVQPLVAQLSEAERNYATAAYGATNRRGVTRMALKAVARKIRSAPIDWRAGSASSPVTPEDTLREAGISDTRQDAYQRKLSTVLSGRNEGA